MHYIKHSDYLSNSYLYSRSASAILRLVSKMTAASAHELALCGRFHRAIELIGRRWTGAIVFLLLRSKCRYTTLRDAIPDITDRMLSERLQELEEQGIVERTVVPAAPVRVEYALTKKGRALAAAIDAMAAWAERWVEPERGVRARRAGSAGSGRLARSNP